METWTSALVSLASLQISARARSLSSGILVVVRLLHPLHLHHRHRHRHHHRLPPVKLHHHHRRLRPLPTCPHRPRLHRHQPLPPHRLRLLLLLSPAAAVRRHTRALLLLSRRLPRRREARTTTLPSRRLETRTFPTWVSLLSTSGRWFARPVHLVLKGRCIRYFLVLMEGGRALVVRESRSHVTHLPRIIHLILTSQGCREVDSW